MRINPKTFLVLTVLTLLALFTACENFLDDDSNEGSGIPGVDGSVYAIALSGSDVYVGRCFS